MAAYLVTNVATRTAIQANGNGGRSDSTISTKSDSEHFSVAGYKPSRADNQKVCEDFLFSMNLKVYLPELI